MAYPGTDPDSCTVAVFHALLNRATRAKAILDGRHEEVERVETVERMNGEIIAGGWFPTIFPPDEDEEEDDE